MRTVEVNLFTANMLVQIDQILQNDTHRVVNNSNVDRLVTQQIFMAINMAKKSYHWRKIEKQNSRTQGVI